MSEPLKANDELAEIRKVLSASRVGEIGAPRNESTQDDLLANQEDMVGEEALA